MASLSSLLLFETLKKKLADTIQEAEQDGSANDAYIENNVALTDTPCGKTGGPLLPKSNKQQQIS